MEDLELLDNEMSVNLVQTAQEREAATRVKYSDPGPY